MMKLILLAIIGYFIYKFFWKKTPLTPKYEDDNENDLIECSICHTFVPKSECEYRQNGCVCKDCR